MKKHTVHSIPVTVALAQLLKPVRMAQPDLALRDRILPLVRQWLQGQRQSLQDAFMVTRDADALLLHHSQIIDELLAALYGAYEPAAPLAVVAAGGYGRREQFPYSDVDLLFLYEKEHEKSAAQLAEFILYILWDLGLKVGQAHRTIDESLALATEDFTTRTNLLDARFLIGDRALYGIFHTRFHDEIVAKTALEFVEAKLTERQQRHLRWGDSRYMLEPNVKEGKGGLRDLHTVWWLARYVYPIASIKELVGMKLLTRQEYQSFERARAFLCQVRIYLHYLAERAEERLTFDRQHAVAVAMGFDDSTVNRSIERFMRRYFVAVRTVGNSTRIFCALLEEQEKHPRRMPFGWLLYTPWTLQGFVLDGQRLNVRDERDIEEDPVRMLELFYVGQKLDLDIHPRALQLVARNLQRIDSAMQQDARANNFFLSMLLSNKGPETTLRRLSEAGVLGRFIPDFGRVIGQTQFNMYHVFTVDEHTLVALGILHALEEGKLRADVPLASEIIHRITMRRVLYLALFCHDIAKGRGGDHSKLGEKVAVKLATRFGFSPEETETVAWLVRDHLLFTHTAFKRDINDPKTIQDFVAEVQSSERLKLLLALTVADMRAVAPGVWNAWKGTLLRDLYKRAEQLIGTGRIEFRQQQTRWFRQDLERLLPDWTEEEIDAYIDQGSPAFLASCDLPHHAVIARMVRRADNMAMPLVMESLHDRKNMITNITLCTPDQHGLFSKIAGAMSLSGANIVNAKIFTLKNGMAIDMFQVQDMAGQLFDRPDKVARMAVHIEQALAGELDLSDAFSRKLDYLTLRRDALPVARQVFIENDASDIYTVIEVTGHDRTGFLHQVTKTLAELGLSIATAHITTYGAQVVDVFYVKDIFGMKITHMGKAAQVRDRLLQAINL